MAKYIERDIALQRFQEIKGSDVSLKDALYLDGVMAVIDTLPAADVAPVVHGVWLESISMVPAFGGGFMPRRTYFCSECGLREKRKWPYCHCGAKVDGES